MARSIVHNSVVVERFAEILRTLAAGQQLKTEDTVPLSNSMTRRRVLETLRGRGLIDSLPGGGRRVLWYGRELSRPELVALAEDKPTLAKILWPGTVNPLRLPPPERPPVEGSGYVGYGAGEEFEDPPAPEEGGPDQREMLEALLRSQAALMEQVAWLRREVQGLIERQRKLEELWK